MEVVPGHDVVLNFAAESHVDRSIAGASGFVAANVAGVQALLQACLDARLPANGPGPGSVASGSWAEGVPPGDELAVLGGEGRR